MKGLNLVFSMCMRWFFGQTINGWDNKGDVKLWFYMGDNSKYFFLMMLKKLINTLDCLCNNFV